MSCSRQQIHVLVWKSAVYSMHSLASHKRGIKIRVAHDSLAFHSAHNLTRRRHAMHCDDSQRCQALLDKPERVLKQGSMLNSWGVVCAAGV